MIEFITPPETRGLLEFSDMLLGEIVSNFAVPVELLGAARVNSESWTGRSRFAGSPIQVLRRRVRDRLYPGFACEQCVGQEPWRGCYCAYSLGVAPGIGPENWRVVAREIAARWLGVRP